MGDLNMPIKTDNSFVIKSNLNIDNARAALEFFKTNNMGFKNNKLNQTVVRLHALLRNPTGVKDTTLCAPKQNKEFDDLIERYIHISAYDPCSYIHEIRDLLLAGTDTVELDITAEAVYIFAKYISKDNELLDAYESNDVYTLLHGVPRDKQKVEMNKWIQGYYIEEMPYNKLFPKTAAYLKQTAIKKNHYYARNSGLFRDIETRNLIEICQKCKRKITNHLHDAVYTTSKHFDSVAEVYRDVYGSGLKFKRHDYKNLQYDVPDYLSKREWSEKDILSDDQLEIIDRYESRLSIHQKLPGWFGYTGWGCPDDLSTEILQAITAKRIILTGQYQMPCI